jgi:hypothetical protein
LGASAKVGVAGGDALGTIVIRVGLAVGMEAHLTQRIMESGGESKSLELMKKKMQDERDELHGVKVLMLS